MRTRNDHPATSLPLRGGLALLGLALVAPLLTAAADDDEDGDNGGGILPDLSGATRHESVHNITPEDHVHGIDVSEFIERLQDEDIEGDTTTVTISADVLFEFDEADLTDRAASTIADIAADLEGVAGTVTVVGHTDGVGDADYNQELSEDRAASVAEALEEHLDDGVDIEASGRGMDEPVADEDTDDPEELTRAQAQNRRVEISYGSG